MRYAVNTSHYRDFDTFEVNRLPGRAYAIPYSDAQTLRNTPFEKERTGSDQVHVLSGEWDFKYYADVADLPETLDTDEIGFDRVQVPSTWQRTGYENPAYINCAYAFDNRPPELPEQMPCGVYRRRGQLVRRALQYLRRQRHAGVGVQVLGFQVVHHPRQPVLLE